MRNSLSPNFPATLEADRKAFVALMRHLQAVDTERTVIMVQVENETGTYGAVRDYSPAAQKLFEAQVPREIVKALGKSPGPGRRFSARTRTSSFMLTRSRTLSSRSLRRARRPTRFRCM